MTDQARNVFSSDRPSPDQPSVPSPERIAEAIERIKSVYPNDKPKCPWCAVRGGRHNFDCPTPDVWFLLRALDVVTEERDRLRAQTTWQPIETADADTPVTLFTPRERLTDLPVHVAPEIKDDIRVSAPRYWTWATHWQPLPPAPSERREE